MSEYVLTATDFRHHLTWMAELVSYRDYRVVMRRHGRDMVALVSVEDLEFLRKHRPLPDKAQRTFFPPEYLTPAREILKDEAAGPGEIRVVERPPRQVVSAEERVKRREQEAAARRAEKERRKREEEAARQARWRREHILNHGPHIAGYEVARKFYEENREVDDAALWCIWAWDYFKRLGKTDGLEPPRGLPARPVNEEEEPAWMEGEA